MIKILLLILLFCTLNINAQNDKTVTLVVSGSGKTQDEAKQNALRSAIEQAFGTFISSKTEILNDNLVKDEIVSVANGNIQKFEIISEVNLPDGGYATSLKATVSVTKLTSFAEGKGVVVEFKGSLFAFNVNQQILNEKNEIIAVDDLCKVLSKLSDVSFEYSIKVSDPLTAVTDNSKWRIPMYVSVAANENLQNLANYFFMTLKGLSLSIEEANNYTQLSKSIYPISFAANESQYDYFILRTDLAVKKILSQIYYFNHSIQNFKISNGLSNLKISDHPTNLKYIYDKGFRIFLKIETNGIVYNSYCQSSLFYTYCGYRSPCIDNPGVNLEFKDLNTNNCNFHDRVILDYTKWLELKSRNDSRGKLVNITGVELKDFLTKSSDTYFIDQFSFVKKLNSIINNQTGIVISFIGLKPKDELVRLYFEDIKTLEEINKISEYKVSQLLINIID